MQIVNFLCRKSCIICTYILLLWQAINVFSIWFVFIPLTEMVALDENVNPSVIPNMWPITLSWYDPESDSTRSLMMMLQFFWLKSEFNSDTRPSNPGWRFLLFLFEWNIMSESPHPSLDGLHLYQTIFWGLKPKPVVKEHGKTTESPVSAVISASVRVTQNLFWQCCLLLIDAPVWGNKGRQYIDLYHMIFDKWWRKATTMTISILHNCCCQQLWPDNTTECFQCSVFYVFLNPSLFIDKITTKMYTCVSTAASVREEKSHQD